MPRTRARARTSPSTTRSSSIPSRSRSPRAGTRKRLSRATGSVPSSSRRSRARSPRSPKKPLRGVQREEWTADRHRGGTGCVAVLLGHRRRLAERGRYAGTGMNRVYTTSAGSATLYAELRDSETGPAHRARGRCARGPQFRHHALDQLRREHARGTHDGADLGAAPCASVMTRFATPLPAATRPQSSRLDERPIAAKTRLGTMLTPC